MTGAPPLILASGSEIRRTMLENAGLLFEIERPRVDEDAIKAAESGLSHEDLALHLAQEKALDVSSRGSGLVLGADQILVFGDERYDKAGTMAEARERLWAMRGRPHQLICGAALARDGEIEWAHLSPSTLWMRDYSEHFLDEYLHRAGEEILNSVGCYQFEGLGAQLFERVEGDYFSILGLPLLPVLDALRHRGALKS